MSTSDFLSKPYTVWLEKLLSNGCSLAHVDGMAVFVPYGIPGEEVQIEITESKKGQSHTVAVSDARSSEKRLR